MDNLWYSSFSKAALWCITSLHQGWVQYDISHIKIQGCATGETFQFEQQILDFELKSAMNQTGPSFLGIMKADAAHSELLTFFKTFNWHNLSISFFSHSSQLLGMGNALAWYGLAPSFTSMLSFSPSQVLRLPSKRSLSFSRMTSNSCSSSGYRWSQPLIISSGVTGSYLALKFVFSFQLPPRISHFHEWHNLLPLMGLAFLKGKLYAQL